MVALITMAVVATMALGHEREQTGEWKLNVGGQGRCVQGLARVADGSYNKGFTRATTASKGLSYQSACMGSIEKVAGNIAARWEVFIKRADGRWLYCTGSTTGYNPYQTAGYSIYWDFGGGNGGPPCGPDNYSTLAYTFVKYNGNWRGGETLSPGHWWPVN